MEQIQNLENVEIQTEAPADAPAACHEKVTSTKKNGAMKKKKSAKSINKTKAVIRKNTKKLRKACVTKSNGKKKATKTAAPKSKKTAPKRKKTQNKSC